jgi:hypothetical protein
MMRHTRFGPGCWLWTARRDSFGYGRINVSGKSVGAHRVSWELANGRPIPEGMSVCHTCDNPSCVNPAHLFLGTQADNTADMDRKGRRRWRQPPRKQGSSHGRAKLTETDVYWIRYAVALGVTKTALARAYGIHITTVYDAVCRKWKHLR